MNTVVCLLSLGLASLSAMCAVSWYYESKEWNQLLLWMEEQERINKIHRSRLHIQSENIKDLQSRD